MSTSPALRLASTTRVKSSEQRGIGLANVELNVPVQPQTVFKSGSIGKEFTATAVMVLVEEGNVSLDDSITRYFPDAPAAWKPVEVKNLLSHTSGLGDFSTLKG